MSPSVLGAGVFCVASSQRQPPPPVARPITAFEGCSAEPPAWGPVPADPLSPPLDGGPESPVVPPEPVVAPEPFAPPAPAVPAVPAVPPAPFCVVFFTHWPSSQTWFAGQWTAAHGSFPHAAVVGSQKNPSLQRPLAAHLLGPHAAPASPLPMHTCPVGQFVAQPVGLHTPSTQRSPAAHVTLAQLPTHR
jgi:hypothetical protein